MSAVAHEPLGDDWDLRRYLATLGRRWMFIVGLAVVAAGVAFGLEQVDQERYEAVAQLLVEPDAPSDGVGGSAQSFATEVVLVESQDVRAAYEAALGATVDVDATAVEGSSIIELRATSSDPELAALAANTYAQVYVGLRDEQSGAEVADAIEQIDQELASVNDALAQVEADLEDQPFSEVLSARRDALIQQQISAQQTGNELVGEADRGGPAQVASTAEVPRGPVDPDPLRSAGIAGLVGLLLGGALVLVLDRFDDAIDDADDLEAVLGGSAQVLGEVPFEAPPALAGPGPDLVAMAGAHATSAEAYRSLRTTVQFVTARSSMRTLLVTSSLPQEGKTTTAANLAVVFAQAGVRVVVLDADLRKPRLDQELLGRAAGAGLTDLLAGQASISDVAQVVEGVDDLVVIGAGSPVPNPAEVLTSPSFSRLLGELSSQADLVLIDTSPLLLVSDPLVLTGHVDAVLLVARAGRSTQRATRHALQLLHQVEAPLVGAVLNGTSRREQQRYGYGYGYGYDHGRDPAPSNGRSADHEGLTRKR